MFRLVLLYLVLNSENVYMQDPKYCNTTLYGPTAGNGTLCFYKQIIFCACMKIANCNMLEGIREGNGTAGPKCGQILRGADTVDADIIEFIVGAHNAYRSRVALGNEFNGSPGRQPNAAGMKSLVWNTQLAVAAQTWVNQCTFTTDVNRNEAIDVITSAKSNPVWVAQNIFAYVSSPNPFPLHPDDVQSRIYWEEAIKRWYNQVRAFNSSTVSSYAYGKNIGFYAVLVFDNTTSIGCGFNQWILPKSGYIARILACNYGPGGGTVGQPIYKTGEPCSACAANATCVRSIGLCTGA